MKGGDQTSPPLRDGAGDWDGGTADVQSPNGAAHEEPAPDGSVQGLPDITGVLQRALRDETDRSWSGKDVGEVDRWQSDYEYDWDLAVDRVVGEIRRAHAWVREQPDYSPPKSASAFSPSLRNLLDNAEGHGWR